MMKMNDERGCRDDGGAAMSTRGIRGSKVKEIITHVGHKGINQSRLGFEGADAEGSHWPLKS